MDNDHETAAEEQQSPRQKSASETSKISISYTKLY